MRSLQFATWLCSVPNQYPSQSWSYERSILGLVYRNGFLSKKQREKEAQQREKEVQEFPIFVGERESELVEEREQGEVLGVPWEK